MFHLQGLFEDKVKSESNFCKSFSYEGLCRCLKAYILSLQQLSGRVDLQGQTSELSNYTLNLVVLFCSPLHSSNY